MTTLVFFLQNVTVLLSVCVVQASDAVMLDLLTYADLELLKAHKSGTATRTVPNARLVSSAPNNKKYLIVTYTVEFDR